MGEEYHQESGQSRYQQPKGYQQAGGHEQADGRGYEQGRLRYGQSHSGYESERYGREQSQGGYRYGQGNPQQGRGLGVTRQILICLSHAMPFPPPLYVDTLHTRKFDW